MDRTDFGQRPDGDLTLLAEKDGSSSYNSHSVGVSSVSNDAGQSGTLANITYPSELMLQEPASVPTSTMNSAYATYGTGSQGLDQLNFQASYEPALVQPHYAAQNVSAGAPAHTTYGPTGSPMLLDGSTLTPVPAGLPLPPRSSTPGYLVDTSVPITVPSMDVQVGSLLPGFQDLTWSTTSTDQAGGATAQQSSSLPNTSGRDLGVASERDIEEKLARMQNVMEEKFGMQRKKFMNHMIQVDAELKHTRELLDKRNTEVLDMKERLQVKELEMDDTRAAATASEIALKESFEVEGRLLQEEIASLKQIMKVTTEEQDSFTQSTMQRERTAWANERQRMQQELHQLRLQQQYQHPYPQQSYLPLQGYNPPPPNVQPFASQPPMQGQPYDQPPGPAYPQQQGVVPGEPQSAQPSQAPKLHSARTLEKHMQKAQAESDKLRAVVIPLEEEIASLKGKLQEAEETIKAFELASSSPVAPLVDLTGDDEGTKSLVDGEKEMEKQPEMDGEDVSIQQQQGESPLGMKAGVAAKSRKLKIQRELERERSQRSDLEIKLDVMTTQRNVLQEDLDRAHEEIGTLRSLLESEKQSKVDLRKTWEMANLQFIELQQQYKVEVHQLRQQLESDGSQRPQSAAAQLTLSYSVAQEDKQSSEGAWSLPVGKADESKQDGVDGPALSRSVDDMLLAAGGADVETGFVSSHTTGLETLLSQLATVRNQLLGVQDENDKIKNELRETKLSSDALVCQKEKELETLKADVAKYQMSFAQEQSNRKTLEMKFLKLTDEIRMHVASFRESVQDTRKQLGEGKNEVLAVKKDTQTEVVRLSQDRERLWGKVESSREEYACLKQQHLVELEDQARRLTMAKVAQQEAETNVAATVEQLSVTQQEMEAQKEQLVQEVSHLHKQLLAEREGRQADKMEAATLQERWKQVSEAAKVKDEAIAVAEQIRDTSKNYLKQKDEEIEQLRLEVESLKKKLYAEEPVELLH